MRGVRGATSRQRWMAYWPVVLLAISALGIAVFDRDSGVGTWLARRAELKRSGDRIEELRRGNGALRDEIRALRDDPFGIERAIREDLGLARPGEVVVIFDPERNGDGLPGGLPSAGSLAFDERIGEPEVFEKR